MTKGTGISDALFEKLASDVCIFLNPVRHISYRKQMGSDLTSVCIINRSCEYRMKKNKFLWRMALTMIHKR